MMLGLQRPQGGEPIPRAKWEMYKQQADRQSKTAASYTRMPLPPTHLTRLTWQGYCVCNSYRSNLHLP